MPETVNIKKEVEEPSPYSVINDDNSETFFDKDGTKLKVVLPNRVVEHFRDGRYLFLKEFPDGSSEKYDPKTGVLETRTYINGVTGYFNHEGKEKYYTNGDGRATTKPSSVIGEWVSHGWHLSFRPGKIRRVSK